MELSGSKGKVAYIMLYFKALKREPHGVREQSFFSGKPPFDDIDTTRPLGSRLPLNWKKFSKWARQQGDRA